MGGQTMIGSQVTRRGLASRPRGRARSAIKNLVTYALLVAFSLFAAFPVLWIFASSLKPTAEIFSLRPQWITPNVTFAHYLDALRQPEFVQGLVNSVLIGSVTALLSTSIASLAAYSLARYRYPARRTIASGLLIAQMLPHVLLLLPMFLMWNRLGLYDTRLGLIIGFATFALPFATLLLRGYFYALPVELEEQAMVDGCSRLGALWRVTLPLAAPGIVAIMFAVFVTVWNDVLFTVFLTKSQEVQTVSVILQRTSQADRAAIAWGLVMAQGILITLPLIVLFAFLQKYLVQGLTAGALKA